MKRGAAFRAFPAVRDSRLHGLAGARLTSLSFDAYAAQRTRELDQEENDIVEDLWRNEPFIDDYDARGKLRA